MKIVSDGLVSTEAEKIKISGKSIGWGGSHFAYFFRSLNIVVFDDEGMF